MFHFLLRLNLFLGDAEIGPISLLVAYSKNCVSSAENIYVIVIEQHINLNLKLVIYKYLIYPKLLFLYSEGDTPVKDLKTLLKWL
ncbi:hypothetical protein CLOBL_15040 [Clostridium sp. BL-8]|nr:hypothetical protein CLOBL_15040 [Clostridium sp. BL-8]